MVEGTAYRRVLRGEETYMTAAGPVRVERTLYKDRTDDGERALVPMELKTGIVGGFWTPMAARQAAWVVSQMSPQTAEELFARVGNMTPSKSSLDRLPKLLAERWNDDRKGFETTLRYAMTVPYEAVTVMASLDGVLAPMKDRGAAEKRAETAREVRSPRSGRVPGGRLRDALLLRQGRQVPRRRADGAHARAPQSVAQGGAEGGAGRRLGEAPRPAARQGRGWRKR